ncbi:amidohydrolase family protein [Streptomyces sp. NPDC005811]|uniref:amidohydrolase family protein n=1 Tax=Streptomyces sp. NPDC005811 TaxID=3154565 RepID=UPI0033EDEAF5
MNEHREGQAIVIRGGTVMSVNATRDLFTKADVLVIGEEIVAVGTGIGVPDDAYEIDASGGIVMPGMIDTHRHLWQTAMRGYGADWTLTQYFVWNYLEHGKHFRPQDIYAGNLLGALEALDAGVTTTVDWSHGLQTTDHAEAAVDALVEVGGRSVLAYGNIHRAPWEWATSPELRSFIERRIPRDGMLGLQLAFDVTGDPSFPERAAFEAAKELGAAVTTHAGVWGATDDNSIRLMYENGCMTPETVYVHAATLSTDSYHRIAATGGSASVSSESESTCGQGYPSSWELRRHGIPISLSMDTSVWWSADLFSAMRATLASDRAREHQLAHENSETVTNIGLRCEDVVAWSTRGGAEALGLGSVVGTIAPGFKSDIVLIKNDSSPTMFPVLNPYGHVALQAQRADVDTVLVNGRIVKQNHRLVGSTLARARAAVEGTVEYLESTLGPSVWREGMSPAIPDSKVLDNPYMYTEYAASSTHGA